MKKFFVSLVCLAVAFLAFGCDNPEAKISNATAFGQVNNCLVRVDMAVDGDGKVEKVSINEYLSIYDIGELTFDGNGWYKYDVKIQEQVNGYAKYVKVGDKVFAYDGESYVSAKESERSSYEMIISEQPQWYENALKSEQFDILNEEMVEYGVPFDCYDGGRVNKSEWANKLKNGYGEGVEYESGYKENIYNLITHIKNHGFYGYTGDEKPSGKNGTYKIGKFDTLVNLSGFHGYMSLARKAFDDAIASQQN